jgi:hypothetical protein
MLDCRLLDELGEKSFLLGKPQGDARFEEYR